MPPKIWLLYLVIPGRFGRWLTSLLIFVALILTYNTLSDYRVLNSGTLFFSAVIAYIVPTFSYILDITERAVRDIKDLLEIDDKDFENFCLRISRQSILWNVMVALLGFGFGSIHLLAIYSTRGLSVMDAWSTSGELGGHVGALAVWVFMTTVITSLIANAIRVGGLSRRLKTVDIMRTERLLPFSRVAIASTLSLIGAMAMFPLLAIDEGASTATILPGLILTFCPMLAMFLLPIWPVHRVVKAAKSDELVLVDRQLAALGEEPGYKADLGATNTLLDYRAHVQRVPEWPFNLSSLGMLALYLIIPPLTWVGAALIENVVDTIL